MNKTLSIIKPDATKRNITGSINKIIEDNGLRIIAQKRIHLSNEQAQKFYQVHQDKPFFNDLIKFITSGPVVAMELEGDEAVSRLRELMGATNPSDAKPGTIRAKYGTELEKNVVHGSDSPKSAERELNIFFG